MLNLSDMIRGCTDTIILAQILDKDGYGYEINKQVLRLSDGMLELKEATLYTTFRRLESGGFIRSYWGDEATGARRRYYAVTELGKQLYRENLSDWKKIRTVIDLLLKGETAHESEN